MSPWALFCMIRLVKNVKLECCWYFFRTWIICGYASKQNKNFDFLLFHTNLFWPRIISRNILLLITEQVWWIQKAHFRFIHMLFFCNCRDWSIKKRTGSKFDQYKKNYNFWAIIMKLGQNDKLMRWSFGPIFIMITQKLEIFS